MVLDKPFVVLEKNSWPEMLYFEYEDNEAIGETGYIVSMYLSLRDFF